MQPYRIKTIREHHQLMGYAKPLHPLLSVIHLDLIERLPVEESTRLVYDFYCISLKKNIGIHYRYGQQTYDFNEGTMFFMAPDQIFGFHLHEEPFLKPEGWALLVHPDFLWGTSLAKTIKEYAYFEYATNEALHLSQKEAFILSSLISIIEQEYQSAIDTFSKGIIITQLESLLTYADRFYQRQFVTREIANHHILDQLERLLSAYFTDKNLVDKGVPSVAYVSDSLHISPNYLSRLLTTLTGKSTKEFIHDKLIDLAKVKLSTTDVSVSQIAYELGFVYPQSFSKLFKTRTNLTPLAFRELFN